MKILLLDIETAPNLGYVWQLWNQNLGPKQVVSGSYVLCWAAKWYGDSKMYFRSVEHASPKVMLKAIHSLLDQADVVVHYYGTKFDVPMLNTEFAKHGMSPPSPYKQVDLKQVVANNFRFPSSKLEYVAKALGLGAKIDTDFKLWIGCMQGDPESWAKMEKYNKQDTKLLEKLYDKLIPWIKNHPNHGSYQEDKQVCPNCGSKHYHSRGTVVARLLAYSRFQCQSCHTWFRSNKPVAAKKVERNVGI